MRKLLAGAVVTGIVVAGTTGCGSSEAKLFDGNHLQHAISFTTKQPLGESVDFFALISGPPGAKLTKVTGLIPVKGYPLPQLEHAGEAPPAIQGGVQYGWPFPGQSPLGPIVKNPHVSTNTLALGVTSYRPGVYALAGALVDVSYKGHTYTIRALSTNAVGFGTPLPNALAQKIEAAG